MLDHLSCQPLQCAGQQSDPVSSGPGVRAEAAEVHKRISRGHSASGLPAEGPSPALYNGDADLQGRQIVLAIFSRKDQLNQSKKNYRLKICV